YVPEYRRQYPAVRRTLDDSYDKPLALRDYRYGTCDYGRLRDVCARADRQGPESGRGPAIQGLRKLPELRFVGFESHQLQGREGRPEEGQFHWRESLRHRSARRGSDGC